MTKDWLVDAKEIGCIYKQGKTQVTALDSATCKVKPGERIAVMGPSGSGKSTFLQLLGGLEAPTSGQLTWPLFGEREFLRPTHIGFVFQMQSLLAPLSVIENVELPLLLKNIAAKQAREKAMDELLRLGLTYLADKLPEELSGGQAQRVAFARVMACRPKLILADEPTGQLDYLTSQYLFDVLLSALENTETALIVATHDMNVATRLDTIWSMKQGRLETNHPC